MGNDHQHLRRANFANIVWPVLCYCSTQIENLNRFLDSRKVSGLATSASLLVISSVLCGVVRAAQRISMSIEFQIKLFKWKFSNEIANWANRGIVQCTCQRYVASLMSVWQRRASRCRSRVSESLQVKNHFTGIIWLEVAYQITDRLVPGSSDPLQNAARCGEKRKKINKNW